MSSAFYSSMDRSERVGLENASTKAASLPLRYLPKHVLAVCAVMPWAKPAQEVFTI